MNERFSPLSPRERWRWEEEREREDSGLESERRFARHGGDTRWGTGGLRVDRPPRPVRPLRERPAIEDAGPYPTGGPFAGLGPRGYHRSDARIYEDVCDRLTQHGAVDATDIEVKVAEGEVTLSGTVATRVQKHVAESVAESVPGVLEVANALRVLRTGVAPRPPENHS